MNLPIVLSDRRSLRNSIMDDIYRNSVDGKQSVRRRLSFNDIAGLELASVSSSSDLDQDQDPDLNILNSCINNIRNPCDCEDDDFKNYSRCSGYCTSKNRRCKRKSRLPINNSTIATYYCHGHQLNKPFKITSPNIYNDTLMSRDTYWNYNAIFNRADNTIQLTFTEIDPWLNNGINMQDPYVMIIDILPKAFINGNINTDSVGKFMILLNHPDEGLDTIEIYDNTNSERELFTDVKQLDLLHIEDRQDVETRMIEFHYNNGILTIYCNYRGAAFTLTFKLNPAQSGIYEGHRYIPSEEVHEHIYTELYSKIYNAYYSEF